MKRSTFDQRFKEALEIRRMTQTELHERTGISKGAISTYLKGTWKPKQDKVDLISQALRVDPAWLMGYDVPMESVNQTDPNQVIRINNAPQKGVRIPVLGTVAAGIPLEAIQDISDYEEITPELAATGEFFALKVHGASMEPRMMEGDVVIVKKQDDVESGDIAIVLVNGNEATVKRVRKQKTGITLIATNVNVYEPHYYSNEEIMKLPVKILGKVVELRAKF